MERIGDVLGRLDAMRRTAVEAPLCPREARSVRGATKEMERQIQRALWRAERRGRALPRRDRQGASWVNAQRRRIAWELARWALSVGAERETARVVGERAAARFPRDGVVLADERRRPRECGESPRQLGANPRLLGTNPRARGQSPRQQRAG